MAFSQDTPSSRSTIYSALLLSVQLGCLRIHDNPAISRRAIIHLETREKLQLIRNNGSVILDVLLVLFHTIQTPLSDESRPFAFESTGHHADRLPFQPIDGILR